MLRSILYILIGIPLFIVLIWFFAVPDNLIKSKIEDSINSIDPEINASITGLRKGLFFTVYADSLELKVDGIQALKVTQLSGRFNPVYLLKKEFPFFINGKLGTGDVNGTFKLPENRIIKIRRAELNAIPYLTHIGIEGSGYLSANLNFKDTTVRVTFEIPDLKMQDSDKIILPFMSTFHKAHGALSINGNTIKIDSLSLEGEKGYARIKGDITDGVMNLVLELMPYFEVITPVESMLISKYQISPGYYVIPIKGRLS